MYVGVAVGRYWGYRCIVTGLTLESSCVAPLWDLERTVASLVGRCVRSLLVGPAIDRTEMTLAKWLDSRLFDGGLLLSPEDAAPRVDGKDAAGGGQEKERAEEKETDEEKSGMEEEMAAEKWAAQSDQELGWLLEGCTSAQDAQQGAAGGFARLFAQKNRDLPDMFDRFGGEVIDEALRWFVAAALRHLRLVDAARKPERTEAEEQQQQQQQQHGRECSQQQPERQQHHYHHEGGPHHL
jgi:hypothetical protein